MKKRVLFWLCSICAVLALVFSGCPDNGILGNTSSGSLNANLIIKDEQVYDSSALVKIKGPIELDSDGILGGTGKISDTGLLSCNIQTPDAALTRYLNQILTFNTPWELEFSASVKGGVLRLTTGKHTLSRSMTTKSKDSIKTESIIYVYVGEAVKVTASEKIEDKAIDNIGTKILITYRPLSLDFDKAGWYAIYTVFDLRSTAGTYTARISEISSNDVRWCLE